MKDVDASLFYILFFIHNFYEATQMCEENFNENVMCSDREDKRFFEAVQLLDLINKKILKLISELEKNPKTHEY